MRQKQVFRDVYDVWAQQERPVGRNAQGNQHFCGKVAYSYAEPIGNIVLPGVVLYRDCHFSVTTSGHQSDVRRATSHYRGITAIDIGTETDKPNHKKNISYFKDEIEKSAKHYARARDKERAFSSLEKTVNNANTYCEVFGLKTRFTIPDAEAIKAAIAEDMATKKKEREAQAKAQQAREKQLAENLEKWLSGDTEIYRSQLPSNGDYLRLKPGNVEIVQTTRGVEVPAAHVKRALRQLLPMLNDTSVGILPSPIRIGEYKITGIETKVVPVGCHRFSFSEILRFSKVIA